MKQIHSKNPIGGFVTIFKISGLAPLSPNPTQQLILIIYQLLHLIYLIYNFVVALFVFDAFQESSLSTMVSALVFIAISFAHAVVNVQALFTRKGQQKIFDMFAEIDSEFRNKLTIKVNTSRWNRRNVIVFVVVMAIVIADDSVIAVSKFVNGFNDGFFYSLFSRQVLRLRLMQCMLYVQVASDRLDLLNGKLLELMAARKSTPSFIILEGDYGKYRYGNVKKSSHAIDQILMLKHIFGNIWEVTNIINECFGWSLLAILTDYFLDFTSNGYWLFLALENFLPGYVILECISRMMPLAILLGLLSFVCNTCKQRSETTGCLVHKLEKSTESEQYNALVSEFSLQVMHEPIHISANGFFTIDFELLGSMAAATVTYLVILIQFLLSEKSHSKATNTTQTPKTVSKSE